MGAILRRIAAGEAVQSISWDVLEGILIIIAGAILIRIVAGIVARTLLRGLSYQSRVSARKVITSVGVGLLIIIVLDQMGVELTALLGAAGVIGIAVGIASQASLSNVISGLFLVSEKTFEVGDVIEVGDRRGVVHSIDPLSIKLRTFDNLLIRIPNQQIIDRELINVTRFPIRRMDFRLTVPADQPVSQLAVLLRGAAQAIELALDEPEPTLIFTDIKDGNLEILLGVWFEKANFIALKNAMVAEIQSRFREAGVPFGAPMVRLSEPAAEEPERRFFGR